MDRRRLYRGRGNVGDASCPGIGKPRLPANTRIVIFHYETLAGERLLATGFTRHGFISRAMQKTRLPEKYWAMFEI